MGSPRRTRCGGRPRRLSATRMSRRSSANYAGANSLIRIFNPSTQAKKHDAHGDYIRRHLPELKALPDKYLFEPTRAPDSVLKAAGVELGTTYPRPIVELKNLAPASLGCVSIDPTKFLNFGLCARVLRGAEALFLGRICWHSCLASSSRISHNQNRMTFDIICVFAPRFCFRDRMKANA